MSKHYYKVEQLAASSNRLANISSQHHAMLSTIVHAVNADGKIDNKEKEEIFNLRKTVLSQIDESTLQSMYNNIVGTGNIDSFEEIAKAFPRLVDRIKLYEIAYGICLSDNNLHNQEKKVLKKLIKAFSLSEDIINEINNEVKQEYWGDKT